MRFGWFKARHLTFSLRGGVNIEGEVVAEYSELVVIEVPHQKVVIPKAQIQTTYHKSYLKRLGEETTKEQAEGLTDFKVEPYSIGKERKQE